MSYKYVIPENLQEVLGYLNDSSLSAKVIAGGTDLLIRIRSKKERPEILLDLSEVGLNFIENREGQIVIGSMTTLSQIINSEAIKRHVPILIEAAREIGGVQTRNVGTIGGNLCTGIPSADMAIPLLAMDAQIRTVGLEEEQVFPLQKFFISPRVIKLSTNQILSEIIVNCSDYESWGWAFLKLGKRKAMRLSIISIGIYLKINPLSLVIEDVRIAMGNVAPVPKRLNHMESFLKDKIYSSELLTTGCEILESEVNPRSSIRASREYRIATSKVLFKRAMNLAFKRATGREFV